MANMIMSFVLTVGDDDDDGSCRCWLCKFGGDSIDSDFGLMVVVVKTLEKNVHNIVFNILVCLHF